MHHRRRGLTAALAALVVVVIAGGACSDDGDGSAASSSESVTPEGSTRPTGSIVPGGSVPSSTGVGPTTTDDGGGDGGGDPSEGIPRDQFCRAFAEVRGSETAMADARAADDLTSFKAAYTRLTDAYQAMAENPPDEVYDEVRAVFFRYDELSPQVAATASTDALTGIALQIQGGDGAENLEVVRDYGAANC